MLNGTKFWERQTPLRLLFYALAMTLLFRLYGLHIVKILNNDSIYYLRLANYFSIGGILQGIKDAATNSPTPFYPMMIFVLDSIFRNMLNSAVAVSFIFGTLCVVPFFITAYNLFGKRDAFIAALLFAANSYFVRYSIWVIREMPTLFFFFCGTAALSRSRLDNKTRWLLFGTFALMTALIRAEYAVICLASSFAYLALSKRWKSLSLLIGGFALSLLSLHLLKTQSFFALVDRVIVQRAFGPIMSGINHLLSPKLPSMSGGIALALLRSFVEIMALMTPVAGTLAVIGMAALIRRWSRITGLQRLLIVTVGCTVVIYSAWGVIGGYFTKRFLLFPGSLLFMCTGQGIAVIRNRFPKHKTRTATIVLTLLFLSVTLHTLFHEVGGRRVGLKYAGQYIAREWSGKTKPQIMTDERIVSLYAHGTAVPYPKDIDAEGVKRIIRSERVNYIIKKENDGERPPAEIAPLLQKGLIILEATFSYGGRKGKTRHLSVYRTQLKLEKPASG